MKARSFQITALSSQLQHQADAVVLYGTDDGEIQYTLNQLKQMLNVFDEHVNFVTLTKENLKKTPFLATDEANSASLIAAKRILLIPEEASFSVNALTHFLENKQTDTILIVLGGNLPRSNALRVEAEKNPRVLAIACYQPNLQDVQKTVMSFLSQHKKKISSQVLDELCQKIPFNQQIIEQELQKLLLYLGDQNTVDLEAIQNCLTNGAETSLEDLCIHLADGKVDLVQREVALFLESETSETTLLWAVRDYFEKLLSIISDTSDPIDHVVDKNLRASQFNLKKPLARQAKLWTVPAVLNVLDKLALLEQRTRSTALPKNVIVSQAFLSLAQQIKHLVGLR